MKDIVRQARAGASSFSYLRAMSPASVDPGQYLASGKWLTWKPVNRPRVSGFYETRVIAKTVHDVEKYRSATVALIFDQPAVADSARSRS
jgi:hypothetical protein